MQETAAVVGYSETAFVTTSPDGGMEVRYFSPLVEVPFCGHATIAAAVAHADRNGIGDLSFHTRAGIIPVKTRRSPDGSLVATLVSVPTRTEPIAKDDLDLLLRALGWAPEELNPALPPRAAYAGAWHPIIAAAGRARLSRLDYDMDALAGLMNARGWATIDLVWEESPTVFHCRNPFPPGGVVEDPATGAAAAAFGGYLRELRTTSAPEQITVYQGFDMGRPSRIDVSIPAEPGSGISVTGPAIRL